MQLFVDGKAALLKIHAVLGEADGLRQPEPGKHRHLEQRPIAIAANRGNQRAHLRIREWLNLLALHSGKGNHLCRIAAQVFQLDSGGEALAQDTVDIADTFGAKRLLAAVAPKQGIVEGLDAMRV